MILKFAISYMIKKLIQITPAITVMRIIKKIVSENILSVFVELLFMIIFYLFLILVNASLDHANDIKKYFGNLMYKIKINLQNYIHTNGIWKFIITVLLKLIVWVMRFKIAVLFVQVFYINRDTRILIKFICFVGFSMCAELLECWLKIQVLIPWINFIISTVLRQIKWILRLVYLWGLYRSIFWNDNTIGISFDLMYFFLEFIEFCLTSMSFIPCCISCIKREVKTGQKVKCCCICCMIKEFGSNYNDHLLNEKKKNK